MIGMPRCAAYLPVLLGLLAPARAGAQAPTGPPSPSTTVGITASGAVTTTPQAGITTTTTFVTPTVTTTFTTAPTTTTITTLPQGGTSTTVTLSTGPPPAQAVPLTRSPFAGFTPTPVNPTGGAPTCAFQDPLDVCGVEY